MSSIAPQLWINRILLSYGFVELGGLLATFGLPEGLWLYFTAVNQMDGLTITTLFGQNS